MPCRSDCRARIRVGIVDFLNSRPLAWAFLQPSVDAGMDPLFLSPAGVADELAAGRIDVGLVPSIEVQRIAGLRLIPGLCVAATREVRSVLLLSTGPPQRIRRLAVDENSRTSAALVRILLRDRYQVSPECVTAPPDVRAMLEEADGALVIGDPALQIDRRNYRVLDLAAEWRRLTGHPFVFALWAVRAGVRSGDWTAEFHRSLRCGLAAMDRIVEQAASEMNLQPDEVRAYLTASLSYRLGRAELTGLREFFRRAHALGLIPPPMPLRFLAACDSAGEPVE